MFDNEIITTLLAITDENSISQQLQPSMAGLFLRIIVSLSVIMLLTYLVLRVIKKQQDIRQRASNERKGWIRIYDYQALGPNNRGIFLLEIFSNIYVVGVTENSISVIKEIPDDNEEWLGLKDNLESPEEILPPRLTRMLKNNIGIFRKKDYSKNSFEQELSERLSEEVNNQLDRTHRLYQQTSGGENDGK
jgi:flagellar biogenesis protein FliO